MEIKQTGLIKQLHTSAEKSVLEKLLQPSQKVEQKSDVQNKNSGPEEYKKIKMEFENLEKSLIKQKKEKDISAAIKTTNSMQNLIRNDLLPLNDSLRKALQKIKNEVIEFSSVNCTQKQADAIDGMIRNAKDDLERIEVGNFEKNLTMRTSKS